MIEFVAIGISILGLGMSSYAIFRKPRTIHSTEHVTHHVEAAHPQGHAQCSKCPSVVARYTIEDGAVVCANCQGRK